MKRSGRTCILGSDEFWFARADSSQPGPTVVFQVQRVTADATLAVRATLLSVAAPGGAGGRAR